jgi:hypothetical protein
MSQLHQHGFADPELAVRNFKHAAADRKVVKEHPLLPAVKQALDFLVDYESSMSSTIHPGTSERMVTQLINIG